MRKLKYPIYLLFFLALSFSAQAQSSFSVTYNYGKIGSKDLSEFIKDDNWRGWQFEYQKFINDNLAWGILSGYQGFYEKRDRAVYENGTQSTSAVTWRYFENIPILLTGKYYFGNGRIKPYLGAGAGMSISTQELQISAFLESKNKITFSMLGEGGIIFGINDNWGILVNGKYTYGLLDNPDFNTKNYGYWNGGFGIVFGIQ